MARPERHNVDYFPHYISDGKKMFIIESKFGNDGYAMWFKILETLAKTDDHWIDLKDGSNMMYLAAKCRVDENVIVDFVDAIVKLGEFDADLWNEERVIWCQKFVDSIEDAYRKRNNNCMTKLSLGQHLFSLGRKLSYLCDTKGGRKPQTKEEYSIVDENKPKHKLILWLETNAPRVQKMDQPLTNSEAENLKRDFHPDFIIENFEAMDNYKPLLNNTKNANKTFRSWAKREGRYDKWKSENNIITFKPNLG